MVQMRQHLHLMSSRASIFHMPPSRGRAHLPCHTMREMHFHTRRHIRGRFACYCAGTFRRQPLILLQGLPMTYERRAITPARLLR